MNLEGEISMEGEKRRSWGEGGGDFGGHVILFMDFVWSYMGANTFDLKVLTT